MLQKDKTYTYEELKEIIRKSNLETVKKLDRDVAEAKKEHGKKEEKGDGLMDFMFSIQNMMVATTMEKILLGEDN